jgi:hypothetical protein
MSKMAKILSLNFSGHDPPKRRSSTWTNKKNGLEASSEMYRQGSEYVGLRPIDWRAELSALCQQRGLCFNPYKALWSLRTVLGAASRPSGACIYRSSLGVPFRKAHLN